MLDVVQIGRHVNGDFNKWVEENLDFEQTWWEGTKLVIKSYDGQGGIVYLKIEARILMEELLGFAAQIEIKGPVTER